MDMRVKDMRVPVTVLTGFLGSGKTTLLNRILSEQHGKRIAVIENEFGEIGVDHELVIGADEEVFEMNNGCICCTVRGDLIRILGKLIKRKDQFDYILIETTGMADPGPVIQTFFMDDELQQALRVDACVTLVDAKHAHRQLDEQSEASEQVAFADVILLNKTDLVTPSELEQLEQRIRSMNARAGIHHTHQAELPLEHILNVEAFNLDEALEIDPRFLEPEYPFEWGGVYALSRGSYTLEFFSGPDPSIDICIFPYRDLETSPEEATLNEVLRSQGAELAARLFSHEYWPLIDGATIVPKQRRYRLKTSLENQKFLIDIPEPGSYFVFTQHMPEEFSMSMKSSTGGTDLGPTASHEFKPDHEHDDAVTSVGISTPGRLDVELLNGWLGTLLREQGLDIFRMKGVLSISGQDRRFVFQGVHMLFDGAPGKPWEPNEERRNSLVFIGRNLNRAELEKGFRECLV